MNSDGVSYAVLADVPAIGRGQAQGLVDRLNELKIANPQIVMINGSPADSNMPLMKEGAMQVFGPLVKAGKLTIAKSYDTPGWDPAKAQSEMQQALTALGNKVDGVFAMNDGTAGGIVAAFLAAGINPIPPITGGDCDLAAMQRILVGQQLGSSYFPITTMAETAAVMAYDLATTGTVPADMIQTKVNNGSKDIPAALAGSVFVTKSNMKATVIADGWWTVESNLHTGIRCGWQGSWIKVKSSKLIFEITPVLAGVIQKWTWLTHERIGRRKMDPEVAIDN